VLHKNRKSKIKSAENEDLLIPESGNLEVRTVENLFLKGSAVLEPVLPKMLQLFPLKQIEHGSQPWQKEHGSDPEGFMVDLRADHIHQKEEPERKDYHDRKPVIGRDQGFHYRIFPESPVKIQ